MTDGKEWGLEQLVEKLQKYIERNPLHAAFNTNDERMKYEKKNANEQSGLTNNEELH